MLFRAVLLDLLGGLPVLAYTSVRIQGTLLWEDPWPSLHERMVFCNFPLRGGLDDFVSRLFPVRA